MGGRLLRRSASHQPTNAHKILLLRVDGIDSGLGKFFQAPRSREGIDTTNVETPHTTSTFLAQFGTQGDQIEIESPASKHRLATA